MLTFKDSLLKIKVNNYVDFNGWNLSLSKVIDYIKTLHLDDIELDNFNTLPFPQYDEYVETFIWKDDYDNIQININDII